MIISITKFLKSTHRSIDQNGVELVEIASLRGREVNKKIKLGICGEHGGDPRSIDFVQEPVLIMYLALHLEYQLRD